MLLMGQKGRLLKGIAHFLLALLPSPGFGSICCDSNKEGERAETGDILSLHEDLKLSVFIRTPQSFSVSL